ncbi:MAG: DUF1343 domain-containing protein [Prevotellaceae bacterium]|jgi:uncharacterized protein YbbC (DUF1343 family)|nr:DUF1343 domain-containing protein [Prevotellaceae bacterium]
MGRLTFLLSVLLLAAAATNAAAAAVRVGAERMEKYIPLTQGKKVGLVANHTSLVNGVHLLDTLRAQGVNVLRVYAPEHGFRGTMEAGESVAGYVDKKSGVEVASIYNASKKPSREQLSGIQLMIFDMQDVGARFYTYLSTLHYVMEACAENGILLIVLDRPNPNGWYIDGPVLESKYRSFIGMHPIPIVHGMTLGELALMINGESWLKNGVKCNLTVVPCESYNRAAEYSLPIKPSPNLPNMRSVYLYPSLCLFEGTIMSVGRGTDFPFQVFGHPRWIGKQFSFRPRSIKGASKNPLHEKKICYGVDLREVALDSLLNLRQLNLEYLLEAYRYFSSKGKFFTPFFSTLVGTSKLQKQVEQGLSAEQIRASWQPDLSKFRQLRKKYLLYKDF